MTRRILFVFMASLLAGCASVNDYWKTVGSDSGSASVAPAVRKLSAGDCPGAAKALKKVCAGRAVPGVTDEALFRLALLSLKPDREVLVSKRGRQLLHRLKREYPSSPWTAQATQLIELIKIADELSHQNKELKAAKEALAREVEQLNGNIKQLKDLDLELERSR